MSLRLGVMALVTLGLGAQTGASVASEAAPALSRIVDRSLVCRMPGVGYPDATRFMTVSALSGAPPLMEASNGPDFEVRVSVATGPSGRETTGSAALNRAACSDTSVGVVLSRRGLRRGSGSGAAFRCGVPTKVLMRVRAEFRRPARFRRDQETPFLIRARGDIATAYLAIASLPGRKPIALASVNGSTGKARIYTAPSRCARS